MKRRILALLLVLSMVVVWVPSSVFAAETTSGTCGENLTWTLKDGVLTISGTGEMEDYRRDTSPWSFSMEISSVIIEDGVTSIGEQAFYCCYDLVEITIPDSVVTIGTWAFCMCEDLTEITIPDSVVAIGDHAFAYCHALTEIRLSKNITSIESGTFECCDSLVNIDIPDGVTSIGYGAFSDCTSLVNVEIPSSVVSIAMNAFFCCKSLTCIEIPNGVESIGDEAFLGCDKLNYVEIPSSVTSIGEAAFGHCTALTKLYVDANNPFYSSDDCGILFNKDKTIVLQTTNAVTEYVVPDSVTTIAARAFQDCEHLTSIEIPNTVTTIEEYAFSGCKALTFIDVPDEITTLSDSVFSKCVGLTQVELPIGLLEIEMGAFTLCSGLESITIPNTVRKIGHSAFRLCHSLTSIVIPDGVTELDSYVFSECMRLESIYIPVSVIKFGDGLFDYTGVNDIYYAGTEAQWSEIEIGEYNDELYEATIHYGIVPECEHKWDFGKVTTEATCTKDGVKTYTCQTCGETKTEKIAATGHKYESKVVKPTCTEKGYTLHTCKNCGDSYKDTETAATGHSWDTGKVTTKATCTKDGVKTYTCQTCGETKTEKIAATGHNYETKVVKPTCTEKGYTLHTCKNCSDSYKDTYVDATGHSWDKGTVTKAPTATEKGVKTYTCKTCGKTKTEEIAKLSNPFTDLKNPSSYYDAVLWAVDKGITKGTSDTEFSPKADCTRAQIVTFLWRYAGSPEPKSMSHNFVDIVEGSSYYKAVLWAVEKGITNGLDETHFGPKEPCTRAQIVTFLWRAAGKPQPSSQQHNFTDIVKGSSYYDAVLWAVEKGITTGADSTHFAPKDTCTRAQGMTFLWRYNNTK